MIILNAIEPYSYDYTRDGHIVDTSRDASLILGGDYEGSSEPEHDGLVRELGAFSAKGVREDFSQYLSRFLKSGSSFADLTKYGLRKIKTARGGNGMFEKVFFDAPYNFVLMHGEDEEEMPIANLGFQPVEGGILIPQIQGVRSMKEFLSPIKWPKALLHLSTGWAKYHNVPEVMVLPAQRNGWDKVAGSIRGKLRYDVTAKREGFRYDEDREVYVKDLRVTYNGRLIKENESDKNQEINWGDFERVAMVN